MADSERRLRYVARDSVVRYPDPWIPEHVHRERFPDGADGVRNDGVAPHAEQFPDPEPSDIVTWDEV